MANGGKSTAGDLFLRMGLDMTQYQADLAEAGRTTQEKLKNLQQQINNSKLKFQINEESTEKTDRSKAIERQRLLMEQLTKQQQVLSLRTQEYNKALQDGEKAGVGRANRLQREMLNAQRQLQATANEVKRLNAELNKAPQSTGEKITSWSDNLKGKFEAFNSLKKDPASLLSGGLGKIGEMAPKITETLGATTELGAAIGTVGTAATVAAAAVVAAAKLSSAAWDDCRKKVEGTNQAFINSKKLNITTAQYLNLNKIGSLGSGASAEQLVGTLTRLNSKLMTASEKGTAATKAMDRFGVSLKDSNGKLLNYNQQLDNLYQGYKKAKEAGQDTEYLTAIFRLQANEMRGFFELYEGAKKEGDKVKGIYALNPEEANDIATRMDAVSMQWKKFGSAIDAVEAKLEAMLLLPVAEWFVYGLGDAAKSAVDSIKELGKEIDTAYEKTQKEGLFAGLDSMANSAAEDMFNRAIDARKDKLKELEETKAGSPSLFNQFYDSQIESQQKAIAELEREAAARGYVTTAAKAQAKAEKEAADAKAEAERSLATVREQNRSDHEEEYTQRVKNAEQVLYDFRFKLSHSEVENRIRDIQTREQKELDSIRIIPGLENEAQRARLAVVQRAQEEIAAEYDKEKKAVQEAVEAHKEAAADIYAKLDSTPFEQSMREIDKWKEKQLEKTRTAEETAAIIEEAAAREAMANRQVSDSIKTHMGNAADIYYKMEHEAIENSIYDIERWKEKELEKASTAEETAAIIAEAAAKEAKAYEDAVKKIDSLNQSIYDKIYALEHSELETKLYKLQQEREKYLKEGADSALVERWFGDEVGKAYDDAAKKSEQSTGKRREHAGKLIQINDGVVQSINGIPSAASMANQTMLNNAEQFANKYRDKLKEIYPAYQGIGQAAEKSMQSANQAIKNGIKELNGQIAVWRGTKMTMDTPLMNDGMKYQKASPEYMANEMMMNNLVKSTGENIRLTQRQLQDYYTRAINEKISGSQALKNDFLQFDKQGNMSLRDDYRQASGIVNDEQAAHQLGIIAETLRSIEVSEQEQRADLLNAHQAYAERMAEFGVKTRAYREPWTQPDAPKRESRNENASQIVFNNTFTCESYGSENEMVDGVMEKGAEKLCKQMDDILSGYSGSYK